MKVFIDDVVEDGEVKGKLYLESDELQFTVRKYNGKTTIDKDGKEREVFDTIGYYSTIHGALRDVLRRKVKETTASTLQELSDDVRLIEEWIKSKFETEIKEGERVAV